MPRFAAPLWDFYMVSILSFCPPRADCYANVAHPWGIWTLFSDITYGVSKSFLQQQNGLKKQHQALLYTLVIKHGSGTCPMFPLKLFTNKMQMPIYRDFPLPWHVSATNKKITKEASASSMRTNANSTIFHPNFRPITERSTFVPQFLREEKREKTAKNNAIMAYRNEIYQLNTTLLVVSILLNSRLSWKHKTMSI